MAASNTNWLTDQVWRIKYLDLNLTSLKREYLKQWLNFLFGTSDQTGENIDYIGEVGERENRMGILIRMQEHNVILIRITG